MIILGIDPGLATMGFGVIDKLKNDNAVPVDYGVVTTPKDESLPVRLAMLETGINKILGKYKPEEIAVEELFFSKNSLCEISTPSKYSFSPNLICMGIIEIPIVSASPASISDAESTKILIIFAPLKKPIVD